MAKQKIEIEVDVPEGWEAVRYGMPNRGEWFLDDDDKSVIFCNEPPYVLRVIVARAYAWPSWLKAEWIACDSSMNWYAFTREPELALRDEIADSDDDCHPLNWQKYYGTYCFISPVLYDFTPPPCTDWRQSKRRRPM